MKLKHCDLGDHDVISLWHSRRKDSPSACKYCWYQHNPSPINKVSQKSANEPVKTKNKKVYVIPKVSDKQKKINAAYTILRKAFLKRKPVCEAQLEGCTYVATECHHSEGRIGDKMLDDTTYVSLCHNCHCTIETQPAMAKELGLSKSRLDKTE